MLKKCSVPTVFNLPNHLMPKIKERTILQREYITAVHNKENTSIRETETNFVDIGIQTKMTGEELERTLHDLRRDKRILQQKLIRRDKRVGNMCEMLNLLYDNRLVRDIFKNQFASTLPFVLFQNEISK